MHPTPTRVKATRRGSGDRWRGLGCARRREGMAGGREIAVGPTTGRGRRTAVKMITITVGAAVIAIDQHLVGA